MRTIRILWLVVVFGSVSVWIPGYSQADDKSDREDKASFHARQGAEFLRNKRYEEAIVELEESHRLVPKPNLLYNIALAYTYINDEVNALAYFERYLKEDPEGKGSVQARAQVKKLRKSRAVLEQAARAQLATEQAARDEKTRNQGRDKPETEHDKPETAHDKPGGRRTHTDPSVSTSNTKSGQGLRVAGLVSMGVGAISLGFGIKFGIDAKSLSDELSESREVWSAELEDKETDGADAERNMLIFSGIGAAALTAGGVIYLLAGRNRVDAKEVVLVPRPSTNGASLTVVGRF